MEQVVIDIVWRAPYARVFHSVLLIFSSIKPTTVRLFWSKLMFCTLKTIKNCNKSKSTTCTYMRKYCVLSCEKYKSWVKFKREQVNYGHYCCIMTLSERKNFLPIFIKQTDSFGLSFSSLMIPVKRYNSKWWCVGEKKIGRYSVYSIAYYSFCTVSVFNLYTIYII